MPEFEVPLEREYFIGTLAECDAFVDKMNTMMGYPNLDTKTMRYSIPREHFSKSGTYIVTLKSVYAPKLKSNLSLETMYDQLTSKELSDKVTLSTLKSEGAFDSGN